MANNPANGSSAIAYYGSIDSGKTCNTYLEESVNGAANNPASRAITANNPTAPSFPNGLQVGHVELLFGGDLNEYIQLKYAPDGDLWASFLKDMCNGASSCNWSSTHAKSHWQGVVVRLLHL